jgi:prepilin-type N-terminal cleavage/methylation domain-containing protein
MNFTLRGVNHRRHGFTLVEVLAALLFMAILLPVTVQAVRVASRAGQVGERKAAATRIAERVLNELQVTGGLLQNSGSGRIEERDRGYDWTMRSETWTEDHMNLVTVTVTYEVQGQEYDVNLATLVDSTQLTTVQTQ